MERPSPKPTSPDGPSPQAAADQERQTVGPANLSKRVSVSWRQKIAPARGRERTVASDSEATGVGQPRQSNDPATEGAEVAKPESPTHKRRSLVAFMSLRKSKGPRPESAPPNLPPASLSTGTPQSKPTTSPPAPAPVPPSTAAATSPRPKVGRACTCAVCARRSASGAPQQTVPTAPTAQAAQAAQTNTSPPSSPAVHPSYAEFLEKAAMVEAEVTRIRPPTVNATATNSPRTAAQRCPSTASSRHSSRLHPDCSQPGCVSATRLIRAVRSLKKEFARANIAADYRSTLKGLDVPLSAAYQVLLSCEYKSIMARVSRVAVVLKQMEGLPVNNQTIITQYRTLLRLSGMETSTVPVTATGTPQRQSVQAGGHTFATGYTPAGGYAPATNGGYTPAASYTPAGGYAPAAGGGYAPPSAGYELPVVTAFNNLARMLAARPTPAVGYAPAGGHTPVVGHSPAVGNALAVRPTPAAAQTPGVGGPAPVMGHMPAPGFTPAVRPMPAVGPAPAAAYSPAASPTFVAGTPVAGHSPAVGPSPTVQPMPAAMHASTAGRIPSTGPTPAARPMPGIGPMPSSARPVPAAGPAPAVGLMPSVRPMSTLAPIVRHTPAGGPMTAGGPMLAAGPGPSVQPTLSVVGPAPSAVHMSAVEYTPAAGSLPHVGGNAAGINVA